MEEQNYDKQGNLEKKTSKKIVLGIAVVTVFSALLVIFFFSGKRDNPTHLSAETVSFQEIKLSWTGDENARQFNIYRAEDPGGPYERVGFSEEPEFLDKGLRPNTEYFYKVTQIVDFRESSFSGRAGSVTDPAAPTGVRAEAVDFQREMRLQIDLNWDYVVGADKYVVYRSEHEGGVYEKIAETSLENYSDADIQPHTTYYYAITQITDEKESVYSKEVSATTGSAWHCGDDLEYGGKVYSTVEIGEQCWFRENMDITEEKIERNCKIERYCYDNDQVMCDVYGSLYTFSGISCGQNVEGMRGICPLGWRIPTDDDWKKLETEVGIRGGELGAYGFRGTDEGSKLAGRRELWKQGPLTQSGAFGSSGLDLLPGGYQPAFNLRLFYNLKEGAIFWSSTRANEDEECTYWEAAYSVRELHYDSEQLKKHCHLGVGTAYLRCMRDY